MPLYKAALIVAEQHEAARMLTKEFLLDPDRPTQLDPTLFPPEAFDELGKRRHHEDGAIVLTLAELICAHAGIMKL